MKSKNLLDFTENKLKSEIKLLDLTNLKGIILDWFESDKMGTTICYNIDIEADYNQLMLLRKVFEKYYEYIPIFSQVLMGKEFW